MTMKDNTWLGQAIPFDDSVHRELSSSLGAEFPADYLEAVRHFGGCQPTDRTDVVVKEGAFTGSLAKVFPMSRQGFSLLRAVEIYRDRLPLGYVPMAECAGGDLICGRIRSGRIDGLYYWRHGLEGTGSELAYLCGTFAELLAMLTAPDLNAEERLD
jgi:hypothetical protein